jgi:hypothetical protein
MAGDGGHRMKVRVNGVPVEVPETYEGREKLVIEIPGQRVVSNFQNQVDNTYIVIEPR